MNLAVYLLLCASFGEVYEGKAKIDGLGNVALPPGKWELEIVESSGKGRVYDLYVLKKLGDRLERLTFQKFGPRFVHPLDSYFDSIGDLVSEGIPVRLSPQSKHKHDLVHPIAEVKDVYFSDRKAAGKKSSYIYTGDGTPPWMSHACVTDEGEWVLVSIHASPFALSPETIQDVVSNSIFEEPRKGVQSKSSSPGK